MSEKNIDELNAKEELKKKKNLAIDVFMSCSLMIGGVLVLIGVSPIAESVVLGVMAFYLGARFLPRI